MLQDDIKTTVKMALIEDFGGVLDPSLDVTAQLIAQDAVSHASVITREAGIFCGKEWVEEVYLQLGNQIELQWFVKDGDVIEPGEQLFSLKGNSRLILTGQRTAINFMQTLSGVATEVSKYVKQMEGTNCKLLDTRKTIPCLRSALKYAVVCGGGINDRIGLFDMFYIRENHILSCGGINNAIQTAKKQHPELKIKIDVSNLDELQQALDNKADIITLDNFDYDTIVLAVKQVNHSALLEVSGSINLDTVGRFAKTGIDFISVGAITKNIKALDLSMKFVKK
jgi:nicotinate-nucleotide pyrophosphorylase (carboxylating)